MKYPVLTAFKFGVLALCSALVLGFFPACGKGVCTPQVKGDKRITSSYLPHLGRFGNQIYIYIFLKNYAQRNGLKVETPEWVGNRLFGLTDPRISTNFCEQKENDDVVASYEGKNKKVYVNVDFNGYFQFHSSAHKKDQNYIRSLFQPSAEIKNQVQPGVEKLRTMGNTLVAIHIRRGDFGKPPFVTSPTEWYVKWLKEKWSTLDKPVLFVASDSLDAIVPDFAEFSPKTIRDLGVKFDFQEADFYPEYYILTQADILAVSNSTFSTSAAMINASAKEFFRPHFETKKLVSFDPWDTYPFEGWHQ